MRRRRIEIGLCLLLSGCGEGPVTLSLPEGLFSARAPTALLFFQTGPEPSATVREAHAIDLEQPQNLSGGLAPGESMRVLGFEKSLAELGVRAGPIESVPGGEPLSEATVAFEYSREGESQSWESIATSIESEIPFRLPYIEPPKPCHTATADGWQITDLSLVDVRSMVAEDENTIYMAGLYHTADADDVAQSLLGRVDLSENEAQFTSIGDPIAEEELTGLVRLDADTLLGSTFRGRLVRIDLATEDQTVTSTINSGKLIWKLSQGEDGAIGMYDNGIIPLNRDERDIVDGYWVDPVNLELIPMNAPEPFQELLVLNENEAIGGAKDHIYLWDGVGWELIETAPGFITELQTNGETVFAIYNSSAALRAMRSEGFDRWEPLPEIEGIFDFREGVFLREGTFFGGGRAGILALWDGDRWCNIEPRPFSRGVHAVAGLGPDSDTAFTVTYSETPDMDLGFGRLTLGQ